MIVLPKQEIHPIIENNLPKLGDLEFNPIGIKVKYFCEFCRGKFISETVLLQHINSQHEENKFNICNVCWKCFGEKSTLKKHISAIHENKRPHVCQLCSSRQVLWQTLFLLSLRRKKSRKFPSKKSEIILRKLLNFTKKIWTKSVNYANIYQLSFEVGMIHFRLGYDFTSILHPRDIVYRLMDWSGPSFAPESYR